MKTKFVSILMILTFMFVFFLGVENRETIQVLPNQYLDNEVIYTTNNLEEALYLETKYEIQLVEYQGKIATYKILLNQDIDSLINAGFSYNSLSETIGRPTTLSDPYLNNQYGIALTNIDDVWKIEEGSPTIMIAIIDTGIDTDHDEFINRISPLSYNVTTNQTGLAAIEDDDGHGTGVAGVIGAIRNNKIGIAGITNNTQLMIIKANEDGSGTFKEANIIEAIYYAVDNGANIINLSLGSDYPNPQTKVAIEYATAHSVFVVGSAGNDGDDTVMYPASFEDVISVGAVDSGSLIASYSNYNEEVDIVAPGTAIYTTGLNNGYASMSGTSFSGPHVAGIIALYLSLYPDASIEYVKTTLYSSAKDLGLEGYDVYYGHGLIDALSLFSTTFHEVSFVIPEGAELESVYVEDGFYLTLDDVPFIEHYSFVGWFMDAEFTLPFDQYQAITSNVTLYAKYEVIEIKITWVIEQQTVLVSYYNANDTIIFPTLSLEHQTFSGWYLDSNFTQEASISVANATVTYYGYYQPVIYTFNFYDSDLETITDTLYLEYDEVLLYPTEPLKPSDDVFDYEFSHWEVPPLYQESVQYIYPVFDALFKTEIVGLNQSFDTVYVKDTYKDYGAFSTTDQVTIEPVNTISTLKAGKYPLYYAVYYQEKPIYYLVRYVTVIEKPVNLIITVRKGISTLYVGDIYEEKGAYSNFGTVETYGTVDTSTPGVYIMTYQVNYSGVELTKKRYVYVLDKTDESIEVVYYYHKEEKKYVA